MRWLFLFSNTLILFFNDYLNDKTEAPSDDPCYSYTVLDDPWRATDYQNDSVLMCDRNVNWFGWYRLFIHGQSAQMPNTCIDKYKCGTHAPLWLNGGHPKVEDGVVTRGVCGHWQNNCCYFNTTPIRVKACPGNYYVYEFVRPSICALAYCMLGTSTPPIQLSHQRPIHLVM
uniref:UMOD/GP2/OIT3-like D8C domain-containing protein n=1 Tax=Cyprinus carpio TaxID=7962 RepID=A0A8C2FT20_CYPCA